MRTLIFFISLLLPVIAFARGVVKRGPVYHPTHFADCRAVNYTIYGGKPACMKATAGKNAGHLQDVTDELAVQTTIKDLQSKVVPLFDKPIASREKLLSCLDSGDADCKTRVDGLIKHLEARTRALRVALILQEPNSEESPEETSQLYRMPDFAGAKIIPTPSNSELGEVEKSRAAMVAYLAKDHIVRNADGMALTQAETQKLCFGTPNSKQCQEYYNSRLDISAKLHMAGRAVAETLLRQTPHLSEFSTLPITKDALKSYLKDSLAKLKELQEDAKNPPGPGKFLVEFKAFADNYIKDHKEFCEGVDLAYGARNTTVNLGLYALQGAPIAVGCVASLGLGCAVGNLVSEGFQAYFGYADYRDKSAMFRAMSDIDSRNQKELDEAAEAREMLIKTTDVATSHKDMMIGFAFNVLGMGPTAPLVRHSGEVMAIGMKAAMAEARYVPSKIVSETAKETRNYVLQNAEQTATNPLLDQSELTNQSEVSAYVLNVISKAYGL